MKLVKKDKKILVRRTFLEKKEYSYIHIPKSQFDAVVAENKAKISKSQQVTMLLERAPWWKIFMEKAPQIYNGWLFKLIIGAIIGIVLKTIWDRLAGS